MSELSHFSNDGFGWACKHCSEELSPSPERHEHSRIMREGEAETRLSNPAMAKWADMLRETLMCPRCGVTERIDKS